MPARVMGVPRRLLSSVCLLLAFAAGTAAAAPRSPNPADAPEVGDVAPEVTGVRVSGSDPVLLDRLVGRVVILDFWATWCGPCRSVMPALNDLHSQHHRRGLTVLGITNQPRVVVEAHLRTNPVGYTIASDGGAALRRYVVRGIPTLVVVDRAGKIRYVTSGINRQTLGEVESLVPELLAEPAPTNAP